MGRKRFYYAIIFLLVCTAAYAGEKVTGSFHADTINWQDVHNLPSSAVNWSDMKAYDNSFGGHSGINWQSFGV